MIAGVLLVSVASGTILKCLQIVCASHTCRQNGAGPRRLASGRSLPSTRTIDAAAFAIGVVSTLMSIGGGTFVVTLLTLYGMPPFSTSRAARACEASPGTLGYMAEIGRRRLSAMRSVIGALLVIPTSVIAASFDIRAARRMSAPHLERPTGAFLGAGISAPPIRRKLQARLTSVHHASIRTTAPRYFGVTKTNLTARHIGFISKRPHAPQAVQVTSPRGRSTH